MSILTFKGGIHPYEGKELSEDKEITKYRPKSDVCIPGYREEITCKWF